MTLEEAINLFDGYDANQLKRRYRELAQLYHPDCSGEKNDFLILSEAYNVLKEENNTNTSCYNYTIIFTYLYYSIIFGYDKNFEKTNEIYINLSSKIEQNEDSENNIKDGIIKIFMLKFKKSFDMMNLDNTFFEKLYAHPLEYVYTNLALKYQIQHKLYYNQLLHLKMDNYTKNLYIYYLITNGKRHTNLNLKNFTSNINQNNNNEIISIANSNTNKSNYDTNNNKTDINTNKDDPSKIKIGDIVYHDPMLGNLAFGIIKENNNNLVVKYYNYNDINEHHEEILNNSWKKIDDFINNGILYQAKIISMPTRSVQNILMYNEFEELFLITNEDYTKFTIREIKLENNQYFIPMIPKSIFKQEIKNLIKTSIENIMNNDYSFNYTLTKKAY